MQQFMSFKSGKFYFSEQYNFSQIAELLIHATVLHGTISELPILPGLASKIQPDLVYSSIAGTAAIEGNPIKGEDVKRIAEGKEVTSYTQKDKQEIKNLINAYDLLKSIKPQTSSFILTEDLIRKLHVLITKDIPDKNNVPGQYRSGVVYVGNKDHGGVYTPPKNIADIKNLMRVFIEWINSPEVLNINPLIRAALAHYYFCIIHPFWDGNGRTSRLIEAILLQTANIKYIPRELSNYYYKNVDEYYNSFSKAIKLKKDATPFLKFCLQASIESLESIKGNIFFFIRKFTLKDFFKFERESKRLTKRQFDLLYLIIESPKNFTLKDLQEAMPFSILYSKVTTNTARSDLKKLVAKKFLLINGDKKYHLNWNLLD